MSKKTLIGIAIVLVAVGVVVLKGKQGKAPSLSQGEAVSGGESATVSSTDISGAKIPQTSVSDEKVLPKAADKEAPQIVVFTENGFVPKVITIKTGERLIFKNESAKEVWPASAFHPTHTVYPGSDIEKCGTSEQSSIFDACRGLKPGEEWSFKFNVSGEWKYHDHLNASYFGTIIVE